VRENCKTQSRYRKSLNKDGVIFFGAMSRMNAKYDLVPQSAVVNCFQRQKR
jgi:hypothetical protein